MKTFIKSLFFVISLTAVQAASADCYIYVNLCAPGKGVAPNSFFKDFDTSVVTQNNPGRCLERAREYLNYCQVPANLGVAGAYYHANGAWKTAVVVTTSTSQIYTADFGNNWIPLKKDY